MTHKHSNCYPQLSNNWIISNGTELHKPCDVQSHCYCTMSELCKALTTMTDDTSREFIVNYVHQAIDTQKDKPF